MNKIKQILAASLVMGFLTPILAANLVFNYSAITVDGLQRGGSTTVSVSVYNNSGGVVTNTISLAQQAVYDVNSSLLTWLSASPTTTLIQSNYSGSNIVLTVNTAGWTSTNQYATASLNITNANGGYSIPLMVGTTGIYSPITTNVFVDPINSKTNTIIVIQETTGNPRIWSWTRSP